MKKFNFVVLVIFTLRERDITPLCNLEYGQSSRKDFILATVANCFGIQQNHRGVQSLCNLEYGQYFHLH